MADGFLASKYFLVSAIIATVIVGGAAGAYYVGTSYGGFTFSSQEACEAPALTGAPIAATPQVESDNSGRRRIETYVVDAASFAGGSLDLCISVGEIYVEPSEGPNVELVFTIDGDQARAVADTEVAAEFRSEDGGLVVGAWEPWRGRSEGVFRGDSAEVRLTLRVPASGAYDVRAVNDVGDVRVRGLIVHELRAQTDVGNVLVRDVDLTGNATLVTDVGDAILAALSVQTGEIIVRSDVGTAEAALPLRADVGYDAHAATNVGDAVLRIGETEFHEADADGPSEEERARSSGFATKPTKVTVDVTTDVGDARITAQ